MVSSFKRNEIGHELKHEDDWNRKESNKPILKGYYFYNVPSNDTDTAAAYGVKKLKSGKWALPIYDKSGNSTYFRKQKADEAFGKGKWWEPNMKKIKEDTPTSNTVSQVDQDKATVSSVDSNGMKSTKELPLAAFSRNNGKLEVNKQALLNLPGSIPGTGSQSQGSQQQQSPKAGEKIQLASTDNELNIIKQIAGL